MYILILIDGLLFELYMTNRILISYKLMYSDIHVLRPTGRHVIHTFNYMPVILHA